MKTLDVSTQLAVSQTRIHRNPQAITFYQRVVLDALRPMNLGSLNLTLPDGSVMTFGDSGGPQNPAATLTVLNRDFFRKCVLYGDIGFGEGYVDGDWCTDDITTLISWFLLNVETSPGLSGSKVKNILVNLLGLYNRWIHLLRPNTPEISRRNIGEHYDLGNDFYRLFLDRTMTYSAACFRNKDQTLEEAQVEKYDLLCRKLQLTQSDNLLEIGTGWGGMSCHAARNYGCRIVTITISEEQFRFATEKVKKEGLDHLIEVRLQDYRNVEGQFDKIVSIEMIEAVGHRYLETFLGKCHQLLKRNGLMALQMITCPDSRYEEMRKKVDFIQKHIFPGSLILSVGRVSRLFSEVGGFNLHDLVDMGPSYARTLDLWHSAFNDKLSEVRALGFSEKFIRKWNYYLCYCEAAFASRNISVVQAVYSRSNNTALKTYTR